jgi:hypothetical protein
MGAEPDQRLRLDRRARKSHDDACDYAGLTAALLRVPGSNAEGQATDVRKIVLGFLGNLFADKPAEAFVLIWLWEGKVSHWFTDLDAAAAFVDQFRNQDVYVGVALSPSDFGPRSRCKADQTAGIPALWIDLDFGTDGHEKTNLPPTLADALSLIPSDLPPSQIVHTGHGLQCWWTLREPWIFAGDIDRAHAANLARRFNSLFRGRAKVRGWDVDSVADLARVMRVPGTTNAKVASAHRPVYILQDCGRRYDPAELEDYLTSAGIASKPAGNGHREAVSDQPDGPYMLDPHADPPAEKFELLSQLEPEFAWTWTHTRLLRDQSQSGYDLALAYRAAQAGWSDQEIVDLLIANRRLHGGGPKLRVDYYQRTIARARNSAEAAAAEEPGLDPLQADIEADRDAPDRDGYQGQHFDPEADGIRQPPEQREMDHLGAAQDHSDEGVDQEQRSEQQADGTQQPSEDAETRARADSADTTTTAAGGTDAPGAGAAPNPSAPDSQTAGAAGEHSQEACASDTTPMILAILSQRLNFRILRLRRLNSEPAQYRLLTELQGERKWVKFVSVSDLISQTRFRHRIADAIGHYIPRFETQDWDEIAPALLKACEPEDLGEEATDRGQVEAWIASYLTDQHIYQTLTESLGDRGENDSGHAPFRDADGAVWLRVEGLQEWLRVRRGEKLKLRVLTAALTDCGFQREKFNVSIGTKPTSRMAWRVPGKL